MRNPGFREVASVQPNEWFRKEPGQRSTAADPLAQQGSAAKYVYDTPRYEEISHR